jgi:bla regulator protein blaR1
MIHFAANPHLTALGLALVHALWEVAVLGLLARAGLWFLRRREAALRYRFALAVLFAMVAAPVLTFFLGGPGPDMGWIAAQPVEAVPGGAGVHAGARLLALGLPLLALAWTLGAGLMLLRMGGGYWWLRRRLLAPALPPPQGWQARLEALASRMGLGRRPRLLVSLRASTPMVLGWIRPVVLVPAGAFLALTPETLEAVLAHELAHVARLDFLASLLQSAVEALLFFHPAAWWLSGHLRDLREHCCDDAAAALVGDPMALAQGLSSLERLRRDLPSDPVPGLAPGASRGNLMIRITRLFTPQSDPTPARGGLVTLLCGALVLGAAVLACRTPSGPSTAPSPIVEVAFSQIKVRNQPPAPSYPADAKIKGIQGTVVVEVLIDEQGGVTKVEAVSGPEELRPTAETYAGTWTFEPCLVNGRPVKARFPLVMPFKLR